MCVSECLFLLCFLPPDSALETSFYARETARESRTWATPSLEQKVVLPAGWWLEGSLRAKPAVRVGGASQDTGQAQSRGPLSLAVLALGGASPGAELASGREQKATIRRLDVEDPVADTGETPVCQIGELSGGCFGSGALSRGTEARETGDVPVHGDPQEGDRVHGHHAGA